jgi:hypothetical protein
MHTMTRTASPIIAAALVGLVGVGCGSDPSPRSTVSITEPPTSAAPSPATDKTNRVAALDDSAVFSIRGDELVRLDPQTYAVLSAWPREKGMVSISAVSPGGRWVALTDHTPGTAHTAGYPGAEPLPTTQLTVFDSESGAATHHLALAGDVQPEAFSVNGHLVFALDHRGDHYRVQTIELATAQRYDTGNRDKTPEIEEMRGVTVRGVYNTARTVLATLYRNPGDEEEPAFVHILDLVHGWAYCADLPPPFGTGAPGSDEIELTAADTALVTATEAARVAEIHINEVLVPDTTPITVKFRDAPLE